MYKRRSAQCSVHCTSDIVDNTMQTYSLITTKSHMGARQDMPSQRGCRAGAGEGRVGADSRAQGLGGDRLYAAPEAAR